MDERVRSTPQIATAARASRRTIQEIARRAVPPLADFCVVFVVAGRSILAVASAHASADGDRLLRALHRVYRIRRDDPFSTVAQVVRRGRHLIRTTILPDGQKPPPRGSVADLHRRLACRSALVLPILDGSDVLGAVTLCYAGSGRVYAHGNVPAGRRVASAIARALVAAGATNAAPRLRAPARDAGRRPTVRRRVAARN
jgi:GAF domain-containing protein